MAKDYFLSARTQFDNLGDALINDILFNIMRSKGTLHLDCTNVPENYKHVTSITPSETYDNSWQFYKKLIYLKFQGHDVTYLLKPGHIFTLTDTPKQIIHDCMTLFVFVFLKFIGVKIKRFGASLSPFSPVSLIMEKIKARLSTIISYREDYSRQFIEQHHFKNVIFCPDLLFYPEYQPLKPLQKDTIKIVFSFRASSLKKENDIAYMNSIKEFIKRLNQESHYELIAVSQVTRDSIFQQELIAMTGKNIQHHVYDCTVAGREKIAEAYKQADIIVSNRLHGLLNAAIYGCHPVAFVTKDNHKVIGVLETAGLHHLILHANNDNYNNFKNIIKRPIENECQTINMMRKTLKHILNTEL
jgi:polysaccharide pyruvyl transferase WcaK-like protein